MIRWEDKSRHTPRGRLADAPPARSIDQARAAIRRPLAECAEERAQAEGTDPIDERAADQDQADRAKS